MKLGVGQATERNIFVIRRLYIREVLLKKISPTLLTVILYKFTDVSKEHTASIFRVEEHAMLAAYFLSVTCLA
jgi:hypothetical protein